jgi:hypothetical protein
MQIRSVSAQICTVSVRVLCSCGRGFLRQAVDLIGGAHVCAVSAGFLRKNGAVDLWSLERGDDGCARLRWPCRVLQFGSIHASALPFQPFKTIVRQKVEITCKAAEPAVMAEIAKLDRTSWKEF